MSLAGFLSELTLGLERAGIAYMVAGSYASSLHGEPRTTQDVDLVVRCTLPALRAWFASLPVDRWYADEDTARDALGRESQFNVIDMETGWKAHLIFVKRRPFSAAEFERRRRVVAGDLSLWVATPEDVILSKLEWAKHGSSERQLRDVAGVIAVCGGQLELGHLDRWATELGVSEAWTRVRPAR